MEKKINLKELSAKHGFINGFTIHSNSTLAQQALNNLLLEFGKQLLELAAENAEIDQIKKLDKIHNLAFKSYYADEIDMYIIVDNQSILDTIKQIE
jgi:hypothetical protein